MNSLFKIIILLATFTSSLANTTIDSLENLLNEEGVSINEQLDIKFDILRILNYSGKKSDSLSLDCIAVSQDLGSLVLEAKASYTRTRFLASKYLANDEFLDLVKFVDSISVLFPKEVEVYLYARVSKGKYHWLKREYEQAVAEFRTAIAFAEANKLEDQYFFIRTNLALNQGLAKQYFEAIKTSNKSLLDKGAQPYFVHANLADMYAQINDWEHNLEHASLLLEEAETSKNSQAIFVGHIRKAEGLFKLGRKEESKQLYESLLARKALISGHSNWVISIYNSLIDIHIANEEWEKGIAIVDSLAKIKVDRRYSYATLAGKIGQCYLKVDQVNEAVKWCEEGKEVAMDSGSRKFHYLPTVCQCLSDAYQLKGDFESAFENLLLVNLNKSLANEKDKILDLSKALNQQELRKQEEILTLVQAQKDVENEARLYKYFYLGLISFLIALVTLLFVWQLRKRNKRIHETNALLSQALSEKETLLQEIHHRVKNNLQVISSLLSLQSKYVKDEKAVTALNEGQNRVESMALIHQNLYRDDNVTGVNMKTYIPLLANKIFESYTTHGEKVKIEYDIDDVSLDVETVIPIGLVLNELISNALKYAFPDQQSGELKVKLHEKPNSLILSVIDNGIGMKSDKSESGFGSKLIRSFTRKLKGEISIDTENGTAVKIRIMNFKRA